MICLDTSVALAHLLAEDRHPPASLWNETLVSSRLMEYEIWNRLHARGIGRSHAEAARSLIGRVALLELAPPVLGRALDAFPGPSAVRPLDALHLASCSFLREQGQAVALASFDGTMLAVGRAMNIPLFDMEGSRAAPRRTRSSVRSIW